jgi:hypothetical protein
MAHRKAGTFMVQEMKAIANLAETVDNVVVR